MIAYLKGKILAVSANSLVIDTGGVGYKIFVPGHIALHTKEGSEAAFFVHTHVREDQISLYGFADVGECELFELLISVSGVGPKVALSIMSGVSTDHVRSAISGGESVVFTKVSGVGRKTAERIIIELREKIGQTSAGAVNAASSREFSESLDALVALGYSQQEARNALRRVSRDLTSSSEVIRAALKILSQR